MLKIIPYNQKYKNLWDRFITESKNGLFIFYRDFMEYHKDRFSDHSLLFFDDNELIAVMPANIRDNVLYSHQGLSFGGIVTDHKMKSSLMLEIFSLLKNYLQNIGIKKIVYKAIPHIYHKIPAEEDLYALYFNDAKLIRADLSATIYIPNKLRFNENRRRGIKKAKDIEVKQSFDFDTYMAIVENLLLEKYGVKPTHTAEEIKLLAERFPNNIKLFVGYRENRMVAGVIIFEYNNVARAQYIASNEEGREFSALDKIFDFLINKVYASKKYFDFGTVTPKEKVLNANLMRYKEGFGARAIIQNIYEIEF
jgi:hypothetical protein